MPSKAAGSNLIGLAIAALALLYLGATELQAQATTNCSQSVGTSSFEFPLWNDSIGWKQKNAYTSIQLADIDGDGQDELIGNGPSGVEVWHWEFHGQAWVQMQVAGPAIPASDTLMPADVDGDGQAEIIQITPNLGSNPVVNVWHYDGNLNSALAAGPGVWRLQPQLRLTLTPSIGSNSTPLAPIIQFANLGKQASTQQQLISVAIRVTPGLVYYTPFAYQVNAAKTGWTTVAQGPMTNGGGTFSNAAPGTLQIGDVTGDGFPDIVLLEGVGNFLIFPQLAPSSTGTLSFSTGIQAGPDSGGTFTSNTFALGDAMGAGYDQIYTIEQFTGAAHPELKGYQFNPASGLKQVALQVAASNTSAGLQVAYTGFNTANPKAASILMLNSDGLDEYTGPFLSQIISHTPFVNQARFGTDPSYYRTIQTGTVSNFNGTVLQTIVVARDASGIHTLIPIPAGRVCGTSLAGFVLPQFTYFPSFTPSQTSAYDDISKRLTGGEIAGKDLRSQYSTIGFPASNDLTTLGGIGYPTFSVSYSQADFNFVKAQLSSELAAVVNAQTYYSNASASTLAIFAGEQNELQIAITALNLPPDAGPTSNLTSLLVNLPLQAVYAVTEFVGNAGIPEASQIAEAISVVTEILADVQQATTPAAPSLGSQTLSVESQLASWNTAVTAANANTNVKMTQNWDILSTLSQKIDAGLIETDATQLNSSQNQAINAFGIGTWQMLAPQVWSIYGLDNYDSFTASGPLAGYPYLQAGSVSNFSDYQSCRVAHSGGVRGPVTYTYYPNYLVYAKLTSSSDAGFGFALPPPPVPAAAMAELATLGVDYHDVLAARNGWQIPQDTTNWCYGVPAFPVAADAPAPSGPPAGAPAELIVGGGQPAQPANSIACTVNNQTQITVNAQSTPINSVFPEPVSVQVMTLENGAGVSNPVPGATVQITGQGLSPSISTVVTDSSGFASFSLLANGIVQGPYMASIQVVSPGADSNAPSCGLTVPYQLQNTPAVTGTTSTNPDVQAVVSVQSKGAVFITDRRWNLLVTDPTGTASGGTVSGQLTRTRGSASCNPVPVVGDNLHQTDTPGQFTSTIGWNFSSCTGLNLFTLTVNGLFTISLDNGTSYRASYSASTNNQTP